jgi:hypothetical protein
MDVGVDEPDLARDPGGAGMAATSLQWVVGAIGAATLLALAMTARRASAPAIAEATSSESPSP